MNINMNSTNDTEEPTLQNPALPVLAIIDVQEGFLTPATVHLPELIVNYVESERNRYSKIIATRFHNPEGSNFEKLLQWERLRFENETFLPAKVEAVADTVITKTTYSAASQLMEEARKVGTREIHFCGIDTDVCVLLTAGGVFDYGYTPKVLHFLCATTAGTSVHENSVKLLGRIIGSKQVITQYE